ncbi:ARS binding protein-like protein Abp2 [Amylocarpus encephaloides]|uniref:ARS binding protein-like protein Abp2 n=1 Tax=Amylocarpus encephaloides TaxID=45428 RepID=A0A9P7YPA2_9HELO|nr:ARS binding protein-like protein Abp2 [Amylocarpus encephaloides]
MPPAWPDGGVPEATRQRLDQLYRPTETLDQSSNTNQRLTPTRLGLPTSTANNNASQQNLRGLPPREATDETFDDAYVSFIFHCNPSIPAKTNATELRKTFRGPPKSDGKSFSTFTLFELIGKLERKELKTWAQLAIELGVEQPVLEKGQSAQKVQQYAVRLKRWMHAMHVDAFFEYLLGKPHIYWTQIPAPNDSASDGRDGVPAEEDLALRALLPETKPKRGRRKAEDKDNESEFGKSPAQRPRLEPSPTLSEEFMMARSSLIAESATPATAHPGFSQNFNDRIAPWSATGALPPSFRWNGPGPDTLQTPMTAFPQSAITPSNRQLWDQSNEPRSAITPNKSRSRRRHGPAVSSAWPSGGGTSLGKVRGRPSSNRSTQDGPFTTFPANPGARDVPNISLHNSTPTTTPIVERSEVPQFFSPPVPTNPQILNGRPSRLQLHVPQRQGALVRLATPPPPPPATAPAAQPPVLLLNGEDSPNLQQTHIPNPQLTPLMEYFGAPVNTDPNLEHFVRINFTQKEEKDQTNMDALKSHFICEILAAEWHDASGATIEKCSIDEADQICKEFVKNLQTESSSTESFLITLSALAGGPLMTRLKMIRLDQSTISHYECHWKMRYGSIEGNFTIRATVGHSVESAILDDSPELDEESWKKKYLNLRQQIRDRDEMAGKLKRGVLDAIVASNQFPSMQ